MVPCRMAVPALLLASSVLSAGCSDPTSPDAGEYGRTAAAFAPELSWKRIADLPIPVRAGAATQQPGRIIVLGGSTADGYTDAVQVFDVERRLWSQEVALPSPRDFAMAATVRGRVHVLGGADGSHILGDHYVLNREAGLWRSLAPLPQPVDAAAAHAVGSKLIVVGGGLGGPIATNLVQIYDATTNRWSHGTPMPTARFSAASGILDGWVYVAGGQGSGVATLAAVERYRVSEDRWEALPPLPARREALGGGVAGGHFCVFGGRTAAASPTGNALPDTWCYAPDAREWKRGPDMLTPRAEAAVAQLDGAVVALGGRVPGSFADAAVEWLRR